MSDQVRAWVRTVWPMLLGQLAVWLLGQSWAPAVVDWAGGLGVEVTQERVVAALGLVLGAAIYSGGRWLERRTGTGRWARWARVVGRLVLALGIPTGQPVYAGQGQRVVVLGADGSMRPPR